MYFFYNILYCNEKKRTKLKSFSFFSHYNAKYHRKNKYHINYFNNYHVMQSKNYNIVSINIFR